MNVILTIKVERSNMNPSNPRTKLYERIIETDSSISIPYDTLSSSLRFIYGLDSIITFETQTNGK